jgi:hypothetical protein
VESIFAAPPSQAASLPQGARTRAGRSLRCAVRQPERQQLRTRRDGNVLLSVLTAPGDRDGLRDFLQLCAPQFVARLRIEGLERLIGGSTDEDEAASRRDRTSTLILPASFQTLGSSRHASERDLPRHVAAIHVDRG